LIRPPGTSGRYAGYALIAALSLSAVVRAQPPAPAAALRIGYIDVKRLIDESPQHLEIQAKLDREFASQNVAIESDKAKLNALKQRYDRDSAIMTRENAEKLKLEIEATERDNQHRVEQARNDYNARRNEEGRHILQLIQDTAAEYARTQGYDLVVPSPVIYANPRVDITDAVLQRLKQLDTGNSKQ
jgi:outer membrane protein